VQRSIYKLIDAIFSVRGGVFCGGSANATYVPNPTSSYTEQTLKQQKMCLQVSTLLERFSPAATSPTAYLDYTADYWNYII
jgi:hypothetical protein